MMKPVDKRKLVAFLNQEGFEQVRGRNHTTYRKGPALVQWRKLDGRQTMLVIWDFERAGYAREYIKQQLGLLQGAT